MYADYSYILNVGCGTGQTTIPLHDIGHNVVGLDISTKMIEISQLNAPHITYLRGDILKMKYKYKEHFDATLFSFNGLMTMPQAKNQLKAMKNIRKYLNGIYLENDDIDKILDDNYYFIVRKRSTK